MLSTGEVLAGEGRGSTFSGIGQDEPPAPAANDKPEVFPTF